jgi:hypothetical protein
MNPEAMVKRLGGIWPYHDPVASERANAIGWPRRETQDDWLGLGSCITYLPPSSLTTSLTMRQVVAPGSVVFNTGLEIEWVNYVPRFFIDPRRVRQREKGAKIRRRRMRKRVQGQHVLV